jgi:hypothetical protein
MNIFFLHKDPQWAANALCDKHVPKMLLESAQMLSTAVQANAKERLEDLYKPAYPKHPMTIWVGHTRQNFIWALENAVFISQEYYKRFNKLHKSSTILNIILDKNYSNKIIKQMHPDYITEPPQCMPDEYKDDDYVTAYRKYYQGAKSYFAKWERGVSAPDWWVTQ